MSSQFASHGRGGAGNMANPSQSPKIQPSDLETPSLKKPVVTTGRGGTGNMAKNNDPVETRLRQDVEPIMRRPSAGAQIAGRGGAGNVFKGGEAELARTSSKDNAIDDSPEPAASTTSTTDDGKDTNKTRSESFATKSKNWLFGKKA